MRRVNGANRRRARSQISCDARRSRASMSERMNNELRVTLSADLLDAIVASAVELVVERLVTESTPSLSKYLTVSEAAEVLRAKPQRVYDLLSAGRLRRFKDGSRVLVLRDEVD